MEDNVLNGIITANLVGISLVSIFTLSKVEQTDKKIDVIQNSLTELYKFHENERYKSIVNRIENQNKTGKFE